MPLRPRGRGDRRAGVPAGADRLGLDAARLELRRRVRHPAVDDAVDALPDLHGAAALGRRPAAAARHGAGGARRLPRWSAASSGRWCARSGSTCATYWAPLTFGNTGNLGLPIALFAFGQAGFDLAVVIFAVMAILSFTFGVWVVAGGGNPVTAVREPLVWGTVAGVALPRPRLGRAGLGRRHARPRRADGDPPDADHPRRRHRPAAPARARAARSGSASPSSRSASPCRSASGSPSACRGWRSGSWCCRWRRRSRSPPTCWRRSTTPGPTRSPGLVVVSTLISVPAIPLLLAFFV